MPRPRTSHLSIAVFTAMTSTACSAMNPGGQTLSLRPTPPILRPVDGRDGAPAREFAVLQADTNFEAQAQTRSRDDGKDRDTSTDLYWAGAVIGSVGLAGFLGFGIGGAVTSRQLRTAFDEGMTRDERLQLEQRGKTMNALAITSGSLAVLGWVTALTVYGIEYSRCGKLAEKKRNCDEVKARR